MRRINLTDGSGRWFDIEAATKFDQETYWDGNNHCSVHTRSQWHRQALYRTASGAWVLYTESAWQGETEDWEAIDENKAYAWLALNEDWDEIPESWLPEREI